MDRIFAEYDDVNLYKNNIIYREIKAAEAPAIPRNLSFQMPDTNTVILKWRRSTDDTTPDSTISYAVRIGTKPGGIETLSPLSNLLNGKRLVLKIGNAGFRTSKIIKNLPDGTYYWSVQALDNNFNGSAFAIEKSFTVNKKDFHPIQDSTDQDSTGQDSTGQDSTVQELPTGNVLCQNYPNPFNAKTIIRYELLSEQHVSLKVYNIMGSEVATLVNERQKPGIYRVNFDYPGLSSGVYIYKIITDKLVTTKKMLLVK
ncbi:MAG: T9SS type A sorting domain-containing protein [archaeon]